jgi:myo-inositol-1(or 4)-monophosphatase
VTDAESQNLLHFAQDLAQRAGELIARERAGQDLELSYKCDVELLTSADLKADRLIHQEVARAHPSHQILSEESSPDFSNADILQAPLWIIDPIDGTVNFAYNQHQVGVSIAFAQEGKVQLGVVYCPFLGELFSARRGAGARLNGKPIRASDCRQLHRALIGTGFPYDRDERDKLVARLRQVLLHCRDVRRVGSAAADICWVAMGRLDGFYESLKPWDLAAAALIAREAGALVGHLRAVPEGMPPELCGQDLVVAAPGIYQALIELLRG